MNLHYNSPCAIESPSYHGWISQDGVLFQGDTRNLLYHRQWLFLKEDEDVTIIQEHDIISESDIENIYTDEELSADDYDDWIAFILFWVYHF